MAPVSAGEPRGVGIARGKRERDHARQLRFARFLNDDERRDFAEALAQALAAARNPVFG